MQKKKMEVVYENLCKTIMVDDKGLKKINRTIEQVTCPKEPVKRVSKPKCEKCSVCECKKKNKK